MSDFAQTNPQNSGLEVIGIPNFVFDLINLETIPNHIQNPIESMYNAPVA